MPKVHRIVPPLSKQDLARFWSKVQKGKPDECWLWTASKNNKGYGTLGLGSKTFRAHRVAWTIANGPIPDGLCVLHHCDNRLCQNPACLFLGTKADNNADRDRKGRQVPGAAYGELNGQAKLTVQSVRDIRKRAAEGESRHALARECGVSRQTIDNVVRRKFWKHVP